MNEKCPRCGSQLKGRFCTNCGYDAGRVHEAGDGSVQKASRQARPTTPVRPASPKKKKKRALVPLLIGACVLLLAVIVGLTVVLVPLLKEREERSEAQASASSRKEDKSSGNTGTIDPKPDGDPDTGDFEGFDLFSSNKPLTLVTGGELGTYYSLGTILANKVSEKTGTRVTAVASGGSRANIEALIQGDAQLGIVQSDVAAYAYEGTRLFDRANTSFSAVAALYKEQVQIVTTDPSIRTVSDLRGRTVSVGNYGSAVYYCALDVLDVYGLSMERDITPVYQSLGDSRDYLLDGRIDAAFLVAGAPTTSVVDLASARQIYLVSMDGDHLDRLIASRPYYCRSTISKSVYGTFQDVTVAAVSALLVARNDVAESDVYSFLSAVYDGIPEIAAAHAKGYELSLSLAASYGSVPYHPGAVRYFSEKGVTVAEADMDWPDQNVYAIVTASAGGAMDMRVRVLASYFQRKTGKSIVTDNILDLPGYQKGYEADPNGYTFLFGTNAIFTSELEGKLTFDWDDYEMVAFLDAPSDVCVVVRTDSPYQTIRDLLEAAKAKPGSVTGGYTASGQIGMTALALRDALGSELSLVDVGNSSERNAALISNQVDWILNNAASCASWIQSGDFRILAFCGDERCSLYPETPTFRELGVDFSFPGQPYVWLAPKGTPRKVCEAFNRILRAINSDPDYRSEMLNMLMTPPTEVPTVAESIRQAQAYLDAIRPYV